MDFQLGWVDAAVLTASIGLVIAVGLRARGKSQSMEAFLLGDRNLPWWAILGSIVATETSTATVLSLPAQAFGATGMRFLQLAIGFFLGRLIVVYLLLPLFFQGRLFSAYEVLRQRFGVTTLRAASLLFLVTRNLGDGLRLFLAALVIEQLLGWSFFFSAVTIGGVTIFYTYFGGMRSIVWNDCIQLVIYMLGAVATLFIINSLLPDGFSTFWEYAKNSGKLRVVQLGPQTEVTSGGLLAWLLTEPYSLWAGIVGGCFLSLGTHGTDQMMVQRYLSARSQRDAGRAIFWSGIVVCAQFSIFLLIGVQLACFFSLQPNVEIGRPDEVYIRFIVDWFPKNVGLIGLMLAAILAAAMSTLSSSLNASASALINDFYLPLRKTKPEPDQLFRLTRRTAVGFGILQVAIGIWATTLDQTVVSNALTIAGYAAGLLLGLFALGTLTTRVAQRAAMLGAACGLLALLSCQFLVPPLADRLWPELGLRVAWPWFAFIGASITFLFGYLFSFVGPTRPASSPR